MFEFRQDTAVIQGAFLSAQRHIQLAREVPKCHLCGLSEEELNVVTELVTDAVAVCKRSSWCANWKSTDSLLADMRAHATVFYIVLRSAGITCNAADNYYSVLSDVFPVLDWSVYVALLKSCRWCEFFRECINDIPHEVAACILRNLIVLIKDERTENDYYVLGSVLKAVLQKLLNFNAAMLHKELQEEPPKFSFPFVYIPSNSLFCIKETVSSLAGAALNEEISCLKPVTFSEILGDILAFKDDEMNKNGTLQALFHSLLTLLDISIQVELRSFVQKFSLVEPFIHTVLKCMQSETCVELITLASSKFTASSINKNSACSYDGWDVDLTYLAFLICGGWNELSFHLMKCDDINQDSTVFRIGEVAKILCELLPLNEKDSSEGKRFTEALAFIADNKLIGMDYALEVFIQDPYFLEKEEILACLEKNMMQPAKETLRYALLNAIMEESVSQRTRLVTVFFHAMKGVPVTDQQQMLQYFLSKYGLSETLKQQNFSKQMSPILNQTVNAEQAEQQIISLCLQSPKECVSRIIHQAVNGNSGQIPVLVKMLKVMSSVCAFRVSKEVSLLVNEFKPLFSSTSLMPQQLKNMKIMIQESLEVLEDDDGLKPSELLMWCAFPCIKVELPKASLSFTIEIIEIIFSVALSTKRNGWLNDLNVPVFIILMGKIIHLSIAEMNGSLKEKVVSVLNLLSELQHLEDKERTHASVCKVPDSWIATHLSAVNPAVRFYVWKFIEKYVSSEFMEKELPSTSLPLMWLHSCVYEEKLTTKLQEFILKSCNSNYSSLLAVSLAQVLPHLTLQEWLHSSILLEECLEFLSLNSQEFVQQDLTERNIRLPKSVEIFVDALVLLRTCNDVCLDWSYMLSCFTKVVGNQVNSEMPELHPKTFVILFLELCRLASHLEEEHLKLVTVVLLDLFKMLKEMIHATDSCSDFLNCLYAAAAVLPDSATRSSILGSLKAV